MLVLLRSTSEERNLNSTREKAGHEQLAKKKRRNSFELGTGNGNTS